MSDALRDLLSRPPGHGVFSVWFGPVVGDPWMEHDARAPHYAASTMKIAVLLAAHRAADSGELDLDAEVPVHHDFGSEVPGSTFRMAQDYDNDDQPWERLGGVASLRWLGRRAIVRSSNLATNLLLEAVGVARVQETLQALGLETSCVNRGIEDAAAREAGLDNLVTAADLAALLRALLAGTAASPGACREILDVLAAQELRDTIPAGLPPGTVVAHKSGWVDGIAHDAGVVEPDGTDPFVLVVCTTSDLSEDDGRVFIAEVAQAAWTDRRDSREAV